MHQDAVETLLVTGRWKSPSASDAVALGDGDKKVWRPATAEHDSLETRTVRGGYAFAKFDSPSDRVMLLDAAGDAAVYVNGELRAGDPYRLGWLRLPVLVRQGENTLLFHVASDTLSARLIAPPADVFLMDDDRTLPTLIRGDSQAVWGTVPIANATTKRIEGLKLECRQGENSSPVEAQVTSIEPLSIQKVAFQIPAAADESSDSVEYQLRLRTATSDEPLAISHFKLARIGADGVHVRTFRSRIDGSVQPYAVRPATQSTAPASTTSTTTADALPGTDPHASRRRHSVRRAGAQYTAKDWAHIVAPTGRRPFGFDWEDWGRIDALEALADAHQHYPSDPRRTYLTGYAMGGHGTWHLGVTYPDHVRRSRRQRWLGQLLVLWRRHAHVSAKPKPPRITHAPRLPAKRHGPADPELAGNFDLRVARRGRRRSTRGPGAISCAPGWPDSTTTSNTSRSPTPAMLGARNVATGRL